MLFSEPKIPQTPQQRPRRVAVEVSVLFSEPKIPQIKLSAVDAASGVRFSALQRAENSSKRGAFGALEQVAVFQCSSASRKFLNPYADIDKRTLRRLFQCSSASRKFLNLAIEKMAKDYLEKFQCSSASRKFLNPTCFRVRLEICAFQCSSASRKFLNYHALNDAAYRVEVSVLFSEPKIPQSVEPSRRFAVCSKFQCSSASRKFLNPDPRTCVHPYFRPR